MEVPIEENDSIQPSETDSDEEDWAAQYQAYLDEKESTDQDDTKQPSKVGEVPVGEDWAIQYAEYCTEKEKEFFETNRR